MSTFETLTVDEVLRVPPSSGIRGLGRGLGQASSITPTYAQNVANLPPTLYSSTGQTMAQVQTLQGQGQQLYTNANQLAAAGTGVANGNLSSVVVGTTLIANNVPQSNVKAALQETLAIVGGLTATYSALTATVAYLASIGVVVAGSASIPIFGTAVAAMVAAMAVILSTWQPSSPVTPTPGVVTALMGVAIPTPNTVASQGGVPAPNEPPLSNPTMAIPSNCATAAGTGDAGGALNAWRDFLEMAWKTSGGAPDAVAQPTAQRGNSGYPIPGNTAPNGFSLGCSTWQTCADNQLACVGLALQGQPRAEAALGLALRWVPFGDPWVAPYQDTFAAMGPGANGAAYYLERQLVNLAYTYAYWPQTLADQQALAYLTTLAWVWNNFPGVSGPLPKWISYKLGHLQALVSADAVLRPSSQALATAAAATAAGVTSPIGTAGKVALGVASLAAIAVAANGLVQGVGVLASAKMLYAGAAAGVRGVFPTSRVRAPGVRRRRR